MSYLRIYDFECPRTYLLEVFSFRKKKDESFSMRKWAREMGLSSHSILNFLMTGRRYIRLSHVDFLSKGFDFNSQEELYYKGLIQYHDAKTIEEKELTNYLLSELHPGKVLSMKEIENFKVISHWAYPAILSLCDVTNFEGTPEAIYKALGNKLDIQEVREKVLRLENLNLLQKDNNGRLIPTFQKTTIPNDIRNDGVREYHKNVLELSKKAIDDVPMEEREFQSFAISMDKMKTPKVKEMIRQFLTKLEKETQDDQTDNVYQFNIQFFRLTEDSSSLMKKEGTDVASCTSV